MNDYRVLEDYAVVFFGSALFKILRLFILAAFSVHFFACLFYRVKVLINNKKLAAWLVQLKKIDCCTENSALYHQWL